MRARPEGFHHIDGRFVDDPAGDPFESHYSATGETIARLDTATEPTVGQAVAAAARAQVEWAATPALRSISGARHTALPDPRRAPAGRSCGKAKGAPAEAGQRARVPIAPIAPIAM